MTDATEQKELNTLLAQLGKILGVKKGEPSVGDVHVMSAGGKKPVKGKGYTFKDYWANRTATKAMLPLEGEDADAMSKVNMTATIIKVDADQQMVTGWASVIEEKGAPVVDWQGDVMTPQELTKSAHGFMKAYRMSKAMHQGEGIGDVVESMVFTKELQDALGINLGKVGWLIKTHVTDPATWNKVKSGELRAFSIGGKGVRTPMSTAA